MSNIKKMILGFSQVKKPAKNESVQAFVFGSPGRTRTNDQEINSLLLYQLSYRGIEGRDFGLCAAGRQVLFIISCTIIDNIRLFMTFSLQTPCLFFPGPFSINHHWSRRTFWNGLVRQMQCPEQRLHRLFRANIRQVPDHLWDPGA